MQLVMNITRQNTTYFDMELYLWRKDDSIKDDGLCPGIHEFPFEFPLPPNIPSSSQFQFGGVKYTCMAMMPSSNDNRNYQRRVVICVKRRLFLPVTSLHDPQYAEADVAGGLFKSRSGRIKLSVELPRSGYLLGETIPLSGRIDNTSSSSVHLRAYLIEHTAYCNPRDSTFKGDIHCTRSAVTIGKFAAHSQNVSWSCNKLHIPENLASSGATEGCQFASNSYYVEVFMKSSGTAKNAIITIDITVGNDWDAPQPEGAQLTEVGSDEPSSDVNNAADEQSMNPLCIASAVGVDSLLAAGRCSEPTDLLVPTPRMLPVTDIDTAVVPPPSYHELFPNSDEGRHSKNTVDQN